jgi:cardiolipin synthase
MRWLPNALTLLRLAFVPVVAAMVLRGEGVAAAIVFAAAAGTDGLDGWLARRLGAESRFGALADPIADKLLLSTVFICLWIRGVAPGWLVVLVFARDAMILAFSGYALAYTSLREFPPSVWGKLSTLSQAVAALAMVLGRFGFVLPWIVGFAATATAWSGVHYAVTGWRRLRAARMTVSEQAPASGL